MENSASTNDALRVEEFFAPGAVPVKGAISVDAFLAEFSDEESQRLLTDARKALAEEFPVEPVPALNTLRLRAGMSQADLARAVGTSQPHIARLERGDTDPVTETIQRLADALGVAPTLVFDAICHHRQAKAHRAG